MTADARSHLTFLTVGEVASMMRVSKMTVYRLVKSGQLPGFRFGKSFRVPENALSEYLKGHLAADLPTA